MRPILMLAIGLSGGWLIGNFILPNIPIKHSNPSNTVCHLPASKLTFSPAWHWDSGSYTNGTDRVIIPGPAVCKSEISP